MGTEPKIIVIVTNGNRQDFILTYASRLQILYEKTPNKLFTHLLFFGHIKKSRRCSFLNFPNVTTAQTQLNII